MPKKLSQLFSRILPSSWLGWIGYGVIALIIVGAGYMWWQKKSAVEPVKTVQPAYRDLVATLEFSGFVDAHERVSLRFSAGGKVVYLGAKEGETVKKGQTLASLDRRSVQKTLEKKLNTYEDQRLTFENAKDDRKDRTLNAEEQRLAQQDQIDLEQAVLDLEIQNLSVQDYTLTTPISGILIQSPVSVTGVNVLATETFEVVNPDTLFFKVLVDEVDIDQVHLGQRAMVQLDAMPDKTYAAEVSDISYTIAQASSGTVYPIELTFLDPVNITQQRLGMNGEAQLVLEEKVNVLSVPIETLITRNGTTLVNVQRNGETVEQEIKTGLETEEYIEVLSGLTTDDQVVLP